MKKSLFTLAIAGLLTITACKKEKNSEATTTSSIPTETTNNSTTTPEATTTTATDVPATGNAKVDAFLNEWNTLASSLPEIIKSKDTSKLNEIIKKTTILQEKGTSLQKEVESLPVDTQKKIKDFITAKGKILAEALKK